MAKVVSDEILKLKIIVNGDEAQKKVSDLELANKKLDSELKDLLSTQKKLSQQRKKDSEDFKRNEIEIKRLTQEISSNSLKIKEEIRAMDILSLTTQQLNSRMNDLRFTMANMNPNTAGYKDAQAQMQKLTGRMTELRTGAVASSNSIGSLADKFNRYQGIALAVTATLTGAALSIKSVIDLNNKLADAQTTVSKTTGLTKLEVDELTKSYSEFNTRSSRMDLLKISEIGGRLGVPKEEIKDFTREVDKAYVALGDGFAGGVESVANKLGKIKGLFKETKELQIATAMNQIGSAMNELGAAGAASEENIAEFALRVGSLPEGLKPTIAEALALGAAFEESGIDAERGGTAYANFVSIAAKNTKGFAEVMGKTQKQVKDLINTNPTEFFLQFSEGLKGLEATDVSKIFERLGISDQFVSKIAGSASENVDRFRKSINLSNKSLTEATSLQNEFNKVNNNSAAVFEKVRKKFIGMFTSETVANTINWFIARIGFMIGVGGEANDKYRALGQTILFLIKIIAIGAVSVLSYNTAIKLADLTMVGFKKTLLSYSIIQKVNNFLNQAGAAIQNIFTAAVLRTQIAYYRLRGATELQSAAQQRLNLIAKSNPWAAALAVIVALTVAYFTFRQELDENIKKRKILADISKEASQSAAKEISQLDQLYKKANDVKISIEERTIAAKKLLELYPEQFKNQNAEIIMNGKAEASYLNLRDSIIAAARAKAAQAKLEERAAERLERDEKLNERRKEQEDILKNPTSRSSVGRLTGGSDLSGGGTTIVSKDQVRLNSQYALGVLDNLKKANKIADDLSDQFLLDITAASKTTKGTDPTNDIPKYKTDFGDPEKIKSAKKNQAEKDADAARRAYEAMRKKILDSADNFNQEELERAAKLADAKADIMEDGFVKEFMLIKAEEQKQLAELEKQKRSDQDYKDLDKIISREKGNLKKRFQEIKEEWKKSDADYAQLQLLETEKTNINLSKLNEKYTNLAIKKQEEDLKKLLENYKDQTNIALYENDTVEKQKAFLAGFGYTEETLNKIKTWEEGRKEIEKYYQQKGLEDQVDFLRKKVAEFNLLMGTMAYAITPEQMEQIDRFKLQINELLAEITKLKNGDTPQGADFSSLKGLGGNADVLGLNPAQWEAMLTNTSDLETNINKIGAAIQATQQLMGMYFEFVDANEKRELQNYERSTERKKRSLKKQLQSGYINQETYKRLDLEATAELDKKKAELEYAAAKRQKAMAISQVITSTALGIMNIWATTGINPIMAAILTGVVGVLGAVQLGTIIAQPLPSSPGAEEGFYPTIREQDGKMFNARRKRSKTGMYNEPTILVGEGGASMPELVVSGRDLKRINPNIQRQYMQEISRVKGFEDGLYPAAPSSSNNDEMMMRMMMLIEKNIEVLQKLDENGVVGVFGKGPRVGKDLKDSIKSFEKIENKSQH